jgi:hypothetical protein
MWRLPESRSHAERKRSFRPTANKREAELGSVSTGRMRLTRWKPHRSGALVGFASLRLPSGLLLSDCLMFASGGRQWAALPCRMAVDGNGCAVEINGVKRYEPTVSWPDRATHDRWSAAVIELVRAADPGAFRAAN